MDINQYKGIIMALMSPAGNSIILKDNNFKMMIENAENIMAQCGVGSDSDSKQLRNVNEKLKEALAESKKQIEQYKVLCKQLEQENTEFKANNG